MLFTFIRCKSRPVLVIVPAAAETDFNMWFTTQIKGKLDESTLLDQEGTVIRVTGWVLTKQTIPLELEFMVNGSLVYADVEWIERPDVLRFFPAWKSPANAKPGFVADISTILFAPGALNVAVAVRSGTKRHSLGRICLGPNKGITGQAMPCQPFPPAAQSSATNRQKMVFFHIPKTGGTSLNAYLRAQFPTEQRALHIERPHKGGAWTKSNLASKSLITGHLDYDRMGELVSLEGAWRIIVLREPAALLRSQLAWVERLADPANAAMLAGFPGDIQSIVRRESGMGPAAFLAGLTDYERGLFDNVQLRTLLSLPGKIPLAESHVAPAAERLASFNLVGITSRLEDFLHLLAFHRRWLPHRRYPRLNIGQDAHFARIDSGDSALAASVEELTRFDKQLYARACVIFEEHMRQMREALQREHPQASDCDPAAATGLLIDFLARRARP